MPVPSEYGTVDKDRTHWDRISMWHWRVWINVCLGPELEMWPTSATDRHSGGSHLSWAVRQASAGCVGLCCPLALEKMNCTFVSSQRCISIRRRSVSISVMVIFRQFIISFAWLENKNCIFGYLRLYTLSAEGVMGVPLAAMLCGLQQILFFLGVNAANTTWRRPFLHTSTKCTSHNKQSNPFVSIHVLLTDWWCYLFPTVTGPQ